jgi:hypothetical protein
VLFLFTITAFTQTPVLVAVSTHIDNISTRRAIDFSLVGFENLGVKIKSSFNGTGSVSVEMRGTNSIVVSSLCGLPIVSFVPVVAAVFNEFAGRVSFTDRNQIPARMLLYKTTLSSKNASNAGSVKKGTGSPLQSSVGESGVKLYNSEAFFQCNQEWNWNLFGSSLTTNHKTF